MKTGRELHELVNRLAAPADSESVSAYELRADIGNCYLGRSTAGRGVLLVPVSGALLPAGRKSGHLALKFVKHVEFELAGKKWEASAAILECDDDAHLRTFCALATDVAASLEAADARASARDVSEIVFRWESLLRNGRRLSPDEELGLWGELRVILDMPAIDNAIASWRGPDAARFDFFASGVGVECKTSIHPHRHHVAHSQLDKPSGSNPSYLVSLLVTEDAESGRSVPELVTSLSDRVADGAAFEAKLLQVGYSHADAPAYQRRLALLAPPHVFPIDAVPRVRAFDQGVSQLRYAVQLDPERALDEVEATEVLQHALGNRQG